MADQDHLAPFARVARHFHVHLGHERTGRVEHLQTAPPRLVLHRARDAVRAENHRRVVRHFVQLFDEHRAEAAQPLDDVAVVHDLVTHVDRRAEQLERALDDVDRAIDAGAETARIGEQDLHVDLLACLRAARRRRVVAVTALEERIDQQTARRRSRSPCRRC